MKKNIKDICNRLLSVEVKIDNLYGLAKLLMYADIGDTVDAADFQSTLGCFCDYSKAISIELDEAKADLDDIADGVKNDEHENS